MFNQIYTQDFIKQEPFVHSCYPDPFDDHFYQQLLDQLPPDFNYNNPRYPKRGTHILLKNKTYPPAWTKLVNWIYSPEFIKLYVTKYSQFTDRFNGDVDLENYYPVPIITKDQHGYRISPHTDTAPKFVTILIPLIDHIKYEDRGTSILIPKDLKTLEHSFQSYGFESRFEDFEQKEVTPFLPNYAFEFVVDKRSWHGVPRLRLPWGDRYTLNISIRYRPHDEGDQSFLQYL